MNGIRARIVRPLVSGVVLMFSQYGICAAEPVKEKAEVQQPLLMLEATCHNTLKDAPAVQDIIELRYAVNAPVMEDAGINVALVTRLTPTDTDLCNKYPNHPLLMKKDEACLHKTESPLTWNENRGNGMVDLMFSQEFSQSADGVDYQILEEFWVSPKAQKQIQPGEEFIGEYQISVMNTGKKDVRNYFTYQCSVNDVLF